MKKFILCLLFVLAFAFDGFSQAEAIKDTTRLIKADSRFQNDLIVAEPEERAIQKEPLTIEEIERQRELIKVLTFKRPQVYIAPIEDSLTLGRVLPHTNDYVFHNYTSINTNFAYSTTSFRKSYIGIGGLQQVTVNGIYDVTDWLTVSGGVYAAKYGMSSPMGIPQYYNDLGINASLYFHLNERIYLRAHGMYSVNSKDSNRNFAPVMRSLFPQTYYGGGVGVKITDKIGVEAGMTRELNPFNGKWTNTPYIFPFFSTR